MAHRKAFKWTDESYSMQEFIETFCHKLPVVMFIIVGWMGRDEEHEYSGDQASLLTPYIGASSSTGYTSSVCMLYISQVRTQRQRSSRQLAFTLILRLYVADAVFWKTKD